MMRELAVLFKEREIPFYAKERRIPCFPHIINIVAQHIISKFSKGDAPPDSDDLFELDDDSSFLNPRPPETFGEACARDPLSRVRKIVVSIRASGQRRDAYFDWINKGMQ
jgi:hypothetical protein